LAPPTSSPTPCNSFSSGTRRRSLGPHPEARVVSPRVSHRAGRSTSGSAAARRPAEPCRRSAPRGEVSLSSAPTARAGVPAGRSPHHRGSRSALGALLTLCDGRAPAIGDVPQRSKPARCEACLRPACTRRAWPELARAARRASSRLFHRVRRILAPGKRPGLRPTPPLVHGRSVTVATAPRSARRCA
jgi:hypothetical protein